MSEPAQMSGRDLLEAALRGAAPASAILQRCTVQPPPPAAAPSVTPPVAIGVPFAPVAAPEPAQRFNAPPSPLERTPMPTVSPPLTTELINAAPLVRTKRKIRTFAGAVAYLRQGQGPALLLLHGLTSCSS